MSTDKLTENLDRGRQEMRPIPIHISDELARERACQDRKWGGAEHDDTHDSHDWVAYLSKHLGRAVMWPWNIDKFRSQMVKIAALAVAAIEWADRLEDERRAEL